VTSRRIEIVRDKEHLVALAGLFLAVLVLFVVVRALFVPEGFGVLGHFRRGAIDDNQAHAMHYAGRAACAECHEEEPALLATGHHRSLGCEACHGPHASHAQDPSTVAGRRPEGATFCLRCHQANVGRPSTFPQIEPEEHAGDAACTACHQPHHPGLGEEAAS